MQWFGWVSFTGINCRNFLQLFRFWMQVWFQLIFIGLILTCKLWKTPPVTKYFDDQVYWEVGLYFIVLCPCTDWDSEGQLYIKILFLFASWQQGYTEPNVLGYELFYSYIVQLKPDKKRNKAPECLDPIHPMDSGVWFWLSVLCRFSR